jgi:two-component sensor histidine kinase/ligand-binding sensor domain-containing protein
MTRILYRLLFCIFFLGPLIIFAQGNNERSPFTVTKDFFSTEAGLPGREVYCAFQDPDGFIWFGTKNGLSRFDGESFKTFTTQNGLQSNIVVEISQANDYQLLVEYAVPYLAKALNGQKDLINFRNFRIEKEPISNLKFPAEGVVLADKIVRVSNEACINRTIKFENKDELYSSIDGQKQVLISEKKGVWYFEKEITIQVLKSTDFFSTKKNGVNHILEDNLGNLWLCCLNGVFKIGMKKRVFDVYFSSSFGEAKTQKKNNQIRGISVVEKNNVKVLSAVVGFGLYSYNNATKEVRDIESGSDWSVIEIENTLYYGLSGNLCEYDFKRRKKRKLTDFGSSENSGRIDCIYQLNDSILLIGRQNEVLSFNRFSGLYEYIGYQSSDLPKLKNLFRIFSSSKGVVVVAENGFFFMSGNEIVDYYGPEAKDVSHHLAVRDIVDAQEDNNQTFWIATSVSGLYQWEINKSNQVRSFTTSNGLPSNTLYRMELDDFNNVWVGSDAGLFRFSVEDYSVQTFNESDGIPIHEFDRFSSFKDTDGNLYFGTIDGLVGFNPQELLNSYNSGDVPLRLLGLSLYSDYENRDVDLLQSWFVEKKINWSPESTVLKIEFSLLDYLSGVKTYAYRIKGITDDWVFLKHGNLTIASLPYGSYEIEIKAKLQDGTWNSEILIIPIEVQRPWYFKLWFIVLEIFFILLTIYLFIRWRGYKLRSQNELLEDTVHKKTKKLTAALQDKEVLLKELHHRVKNNLQIINGLFELQKDQLTDKKVIQVLNDGQSRLSSIALIHQNFYGGTNLEVIEFKQFLTDLVMAVSQLFESNHGAIECIVHSDDVSVDINSAIPLGLIVNELLTNSYKYIPKSHKKKIVEINLASSAEGDCELIYKDNGLGLPAHINFESSPKLGLRLVRGLVEQIKGTVTYHFNEGSVFTIQFKGLKKTE